MVTKILLVAFASLSLSLAAPLPAKEDLLRSEGHHRQPRPFFVFDNSIPGTHYTGQTQGNPDVSSLFPNFPLPWSVVLPPVPFISGTGLLNENNLIPMFYSTNEATGATLGYYLINPLENYTFNDLIGYINGVGRSSRGTSPTDGPNPGVPTLTKQQLNELVRMYQQQMTSVQPGATFNSPNMFTAPFYYQSAQNSPFNASPFSSQLSQYHNFANGNSRPMFTSPANPALPGQMPANGGLPIGTTAPIPDAKAGTKVSEEVQQDENTVASLDGSAGEEVTRDHGEDDVFESTTQQGVEADEYDVVDGVTEETLEGVTKEIL